MILKRIPRLALTCPGQGILPQGCLHHLRKHRDLFDKSLQCIDEIMGSNFSKALLDVPHNRPDPWNLSTANAQPAILGATYVLCEVFRKLHGIDLVAHPRTFFLLGHSLGEYSALVLGGAVPFEDGTRLVRKRGLLMEEFPQRSEMHVLVFRQAAFEKVIDITQREDVLACINSETQVSISGDPEKLKDVISTLNSSKKTILKDVILPVHIPFHNKVLEPVEHELRKILATSSNSLKSIVCNVDGVARTEDVLRHTISATSRPVQWKKSMDFLGDNGCDVVLNLGPGNALDGMNGRFSIQNLALRNEEDMLALVAVLDSTSE
ncbi:FabD/lysophospholipase-like protein [Metschnikowia bicuspidata]|uniref:[acyl-carrier-protein] S-malonyltransferase n=1 Tax=Metschnikowia bicuspidata TaxID=27322 RepID=A0A4P9ZDN3_9ASCO|nr:FabD/lysophospholipase-like protein [Metschnikowia bicuspidata]